MAAVAVAMPDDNTAFTEVLQDANPRIECVTHGGAPWCRSIGTVPLSLDKVASTLENMPAHQELFDSITSIKVLANDTLHVTLDYPVPFWDRDYVARYVRSNDGGIWRYRWTPVNDAAAPEVKGVVRLPNMAGEWKLEAAGSQTKVTYMWQAEVVGNVPTNAARQKAGNEAIKDITKAAKAAHGS